MKKNSPGSSLPFISKPAAVRRRWTRAGFMKGPSLSGPRQRPATQAEAPVPVTGMKTGGCVFVRGEMPPPSVPSRRVRSVARYLRIGVIRHGSARGSTDASQSF